MLMNDNFLTNGLKGRRILAPYKKSKVGFESPFISRRSTRHFCHVFFYASSKVRLWLSVNMVLRHAVIREKLSFNLLTLGRPFFERNTAKLHTHGAISMDVTNAPNSPPVIDRLIDNLNHHTASFNQQMQLMQFVIDYAFTPDRDANIEAVKSQFSNLMQEYTKFNHHLCEIENLRGVT